MVLFRQSNYTLAVGSIYAFTEQHTQKTRELNRDLWFWAQQQLQELPSGCETILFTDANGKVGQTRAGGDVQIGGIDDVHAEAMGYRRRRDESGHVGDVVTWTQNQRT